MFYKEWLFIFETVNLSLFKECAHALDLICGFKALGKMLFLDVDRMIEIAEISICKGLSVEKLEKRHMVITGLWFGGSQMAMPIIGYFVGGSFYEAIQSVDHWLSFALLLVFGVFGIGVSGKLRVVLGVVFGIAFVVCAKYTQWCVYAYRSFSYDGERKLSKQIIDGTAEHITLPEGGVGLDIGCGSGALTIACAKRNPQGKMVGIDRWGKEYASFSLPLCEKNAAAAGVKNASFRRGNAVKLDFPDESFDAVTSNYVYHNITGADKQALLLETLRVLKKGGTYAIHDLMSPGRYGDMQAFVQKLRDMGYERVELIDTTDGSFMTPKEAKRLMLRGSTLLAGRK